MPHPVVYSGDMNALVKEWEDKWRQTFREKGKEGLKHLMIGNGECVALPQGLTNVGWTGRWQRGDRVIDVAKMLKPGTVIANFKMIDGKWQYPRPPAIVHGHHAALFVGADSFNGSKASRIRMFDQWRSGEGKWPSARWVKMQPSASLRLPCDKAEDFYVVLVQ